MITYAINRSTKEHRRVTLPEPGVLADFRGWNIVKADEDGWIPWEGGECPLPSGQDVEVIVAGGFVRVGRANLFNWCEDRLPELVKEYRPIMSDEDEPFDWEASKKKVDKAWVNSVRARAFLSNGEDDTEWKEGLPPIGCECEVRHYHPTRGGWVWSECEIVAHRGNLAIAFIEEGGMSFAVNEASFRPIRSAEDREVEEMMDIAAGCLDEYTARKLYRAGYRKEN